MNKNLTKWLDNIQPLGPTQMNLSLERVAEMVQRLNIQKTCPIITVAGTNGKGSTVKGLEAIYVAAGYRVGTFTSPFLFHYNEQMRINGFPIEDRHIYQRFLEIKDKSCDIQLTPFEFTTLTALQLFTKAHLDLWILEVGLGGRWDAVNVMDTDLAIITSISFDHTEWLGDTRDKIAYEKAGIYRFQKPVVCGDSDPPHSLVKEAELKEAPFYCLGRDFTYQIMNDTIGWNWHSRYNQFFNLPMPSLLLQNMSSVLMAVELFQRILPINEFTIRSAFDQMKLPGRLQRIYGKITHLLDVSHNPASVDILRDYIKKQTIIGKKRAVFSMLSDKDISSTLTNIKGEIHAWYVAPIQHQRAASIEKIMNAFGENKLHATYFSSLKEAYLKAFEDCDPDDWIIIFGSFHTISEIHGEIKYS